MSGLACRRLLLITATPVQNDLQELYNLVTLLEPGALDTFPRFAAGSSRAAIGACRRTPLPSPGT